MRHKYDTRAIVLARAPFGETHAHLAVLTSDLGLVWARAAGLRRAESKLAHALVTFAESDVVLVRGREGWRITGAILRENWFVRLEMSDARRRAARVAGLLLRLSPGESPERSPFAILTSFFDALSHEAEQVREGAEMLAVAHLLATLGFAEVENAREEVVSPFSPENLVRVANEREHYITRINRGIAASGL
ncbi:MAG: recombination protein O N-terminal domain-containing protein [bacterium]|nr:recombination protein O N-terminal domain-containing protein [bacterium]